MSAPAGWHFIELDLAVGAAKGNPEWIDWYELEGMGELLGFLWSPAIQRRAEFADFLRARGDDLPI